MAKSTKKKLRKKKRNLSAKQIRYFGTPAQKAALKASRKKKRKTKKSNPGKKRYAAKKSSSKSSKKKYTKKAKKRNPTPEIISFVMGNPGSKKKGKKKMASKKKYTKKAASKKTNAGYRKGKKKVTHHKKRNPSIGRPMDWIKGGVGVIAGGVGTRVIPQFLGSTNTGGVGYMLNAGTAIALAIATHAFTKDAVLTASVAAGGFAALILRVVNDMTPYGSALSLSGFGDYMVSNWVTPQRIVNPGSAMWEVPSGWGQMPAISGAMPANSGSDARTSGNAY